MTPTRSGTLDVITGPMFSGKSEELMRRVRRARIAGIEVLVLGHSLDTRGDLASVTSHAGAHIPAVPVPDLSSLAEAAAGSRASLVAIDEAQFFGPGLVDLVDDLLARGIDVIVEGLCVTFDGGPFEPLPSLMALADHVVKLTAICTVCGREAAFHEKLAAASGGDVSRGEVDAGGDGVGEKDDASRIDASNIGGAESYAARCRDHFRS